MEELAFPCDSVVTNPPTMWEPQEMRVRSMGQEDHLEKYMATYSSITARIIPWTEEPGEGQLEWSQNNNK